MSDVDIGILKKYYGGMHTEDVRVKKPGVFRLLCQKITRIWCAISLWLKPSKNKLVNLVVLHVRNNMLNDDPNSMSMRLCNFVFKKAFETLFMSNSFPVPYNNGDITKSSVIIELTQEIYQQLSQASFKYDDSVNERVNISQQDIKKQIELLLDGSIRDSVSKKGSDELKDLMAKDRDIQEVVPLEVQLRQIGSIREFECQYSSGTFLNNLDTLVKGIRRFPKKWMECSAESSELLYDQGQDKSTTPERRQLVESYDTICSTVTDLKDSLSSYVKQCIDAQGDSTEVSQEEHIKTAKGILSYIVDKRVFLVCESLKNEANNMAATLEVMIESTKLDSKSKDLADKLASSAKSLLNDTRLAIESLESKVKDVQQYRVEIN